MQEMDDHSFGGGWTEIKLKALSEYLQFYTAALQSQPTLENAFQTWYVDAFAGSGRRTTHVEVGGIFTDEPSRVETRMLDGSARKALAVMPHFQHCVFIEQNLRRFRALEKMKSEFPSRSIKVVRGDANVELRAIFEAPPWLQGTANSRLQRSVVFLDPYGINVSWSTMELLASTQRVDVWYLLNIAAVNRQLARDLANVDEHKVRRLNEVFGTADWKDDLYQSLPRQSDLFGGYDAERKRRMVETRDIEAYARTRLGRLFNYVSDPIPLMIKKRPHFSLLCLSNNPSPRAIDLIKKGVKHVVEKYGQASHHRFGR